MLFDTLFRLDSWNQKLMVAAHALKTEIHPDSENCEARFAAGVRLLHDESVANINIHEISPFVLIIVPKYYTIKKQDMVYLFYK